MNHPHVHGPDCQHDHEQEHVHGPDCDHEHHHHHEPQQPHLNPLRNIGRNDACPCGSGQKYKKCHGR